MIRLQIQKIINVYQSDKHLLLARSRRHIQNYARNLMKVRVDLRELLWNEKWW
jgi:hypothetical protein